MTVLGANRWRRVLLHRVGTSNLRITILTVLLQRGRKLVGSAFNTTAAPGVECSPGFLLLRDTLSTAAVTAVTNASRSTSAGTLTHPDRTTFDTAALLHPTVRAMSVTDAVPHKSRIMAREATDSLAHLEELRLERCMYSFPLATLFAPKRWCCIILRFKKK
jgi:hypothetical protein